MAFISNQNRDYFGQSSLYVYDVATDSAELVAPGGKIVLAGILDEQATGVRQAGEAQGLHYQETLSQGDWVALILVK